MGILFGFLIVFVVIILILISIGYLIDLLPTDKPKENQAATQTLSEQTRLQIEKEILQEMWKARLVKEQQLIKERKS